MKTLLAGQHLLLALCLYVSLNKILILNYYYIVLIFFFCLRYSIIKSFTTQNKIKTKKSKMFTLDSYDGLWLTWNWILDYFGLTLIKKKKRFEVKFKKLVVIPFRFKQKVQFNFKLNVCFVGGLTWNWLVRFDGMIKKFVCTSVQNHIF